MTGEWFVEVYSSPAAPGQPKFFDDFAATLAFVEDFKVRASDEALRVHFPARATDAERQELVECGAAPV
jgi:hypothetical protein